jgi:hypothetical protein
MITFSIGTFHLFIAGSSVVSLLAAPRAHDICFEITLVMSKALALETVDCHVLTFEFI